MGGQDSGSPAEGEAAGQTGSWQFLPRRPGAVCWCHMALYDTFVPAFQSRRLSQEARSNGYVCGAAVRRPGSSHSCTGAKGAVSSCSSGRAAGIGVRGSRWRAASRNDPKAVGWPPASQTEGPGGQGAGRHLGVWDPSSLPVSRPFLTGSGFLNPNSRKTEAARAKGQRDGRAGTAPTERRGWSCKFQRASPPPSLSLNLGGVEGGVIGKGVYKCFSIGRREGGRMEVDS